MTFDQANRKGLYFSPRWYPYSGHSLLPRSQWQNFGRMPRSKPTPLANKYTSFIKYSQSNNPIDANFLPGLGDITDDIKGAVGSVIKDVNDKTQQLEDALKLITILSFSACVLGTINLLKR